MFSYELLKVLHIIAIFLFLSGITVDFFSRSNNKQGIKVFVGMSSFFIILGGMGLLSKLGTIESMTRLPLWVNIKILCWLALSVLGPIFTMRITEKTSRTYAYVFIVFIMCLAATLAVFRPE
jgi:uncharacterized membrane protein SirB2